MTKSPFALVISVILFIIGGAFLLGRNNLSSLNKPTKTPLKQITVQLKWLHQAQFAGLYMAKEKGFYAAEGLDVTFLPYDFKIDVVGSVENMTVDFAVTGATDLIEAGLSGDTSVRAIAAIYRKSPYTLYALKKTGITGPSDLIGKKIGLQPIFDGKVLFNTMISALHLNPDSFTVVATGYDAGDLLSGAVDVSSGYITNEPQLVIQKGFEVTTLLMADYGANLYGDILVANKDTISNDPDLVTRFFNATMKGWSYALENENETIDTVLKYKPDGDREHERYMLRQSIPLIHTGNEPIGWMLRDEWQRFIGLVSKNSDSTNEINADDLFTTQFLDNYYR